MKTLPIINSDKVIKVDDRDFQRLSKFTWRLNRKGYPFFTRTLHGFLLGKREGFEIDHKDGDKLNGQRSNFRWATHTQNLQNSCKRANVSSPFKGVSWHTGRGAWRAVINVNYKQVHLGFFEDAVEAALAYDKAAIKYFKEFARINFPSNNKRKTCLRHPYERR